MSQLKWEDHEIEELLKKLPEIKDGRSPNEVYYNVQRKMNKRLSVKPWLPVIATISAILILAFITPTFINQYSSSEDSEMENSNEAQELYSFDKSVEEKVERNGNVSTQNESSNDAAISKEGPNQKMEMVPATTNKLSVYGEDLSHYDSFYYRFITTDATTVPVSVLVKKEKNDQGWLTRFNTISKEIPEKEWGFEDTYPLDGELSINHETLEYTIPEKHQIDQSSTTENNFIKIFQYSLIGSGFQEIVLKTHDGKVPKFSHSGSIPKIEVEETMTKKAYYRYELSNNDSYFVKGNKSYDTVEAALNAMKAAPNSMYKSILPSKISFDVSRNGTTVNIAFKHQMNLNDFNSKESMALVEGILLTASEFGYKKVTFENIEPPKWESFNFTEPVEVPVSPNKKILP
ncbi:hypothetical protein JOC86_000931 [Bacillus pakistanensis]|uniref:GerMN domain-containing protein n=1 Tax=Rossellomorea pakistanensis TaxID=992288 RepID=A0ABS2N996_9BACI|nr:hypothetical protein [Bacillus pakistanensis]MBM7584394.1 hypothetical protein [Bacillus pakistanensis]